MHLSLISCRENFLDLLGIFLLFFLGSLIFVIILLHFEGEVLLVLLLEFVLLKIYLVGEGRL